MTADFRRLAREMIELLSGPLAERNNGDVVLTGHGTLLEPRPERRRLFGHHTRRKATA